MERKHAEEASVRDTPQKRVRVGEEEGGGEGACVWGGGGGAGRVPKGSRCRKVGGQKSDLATALCRWIPILKWKPPLSKLRLTSNLRCYLQQGKNLFVSFGGTHTLFSSHFERWRFFFTVSTHPGALTCSCAFLWTLLNFVFFSPCVFANPFLFRMFFFAGGKGFCLNTKLYILAKLYTLHRTPCMWKSCPVLS